MWAYLPFLPAPSLLLPPRSQITHERKTLFIVWLLAALVLPGYMAFKLVVYIDEQDQLPTDHITLTQLIFVRT